jgi:hypothetical protein
LSPSNPQKKGTLIFTGTLGALRCSAEFAAYGAGRAAVRQLAQSLAREFSPSGIHVVHTIANGGIRDVGEGASGEQGVVEEEREKVKEGKRIAAESVGKVYLGLCEQGPDLWTHELDMRPAQERFWGCRGGMVAVVEVAKREWHCSNCFGKCSNLQVVMGISSFRQTLFESLFILKRKMKPIELLYESSECKRDLISI